MFNYQATANILGNSYAGESGFDAVTQSNPINFKDNNSTHGRARPTMKTMQALKTK